MTGHRSAGRISRMAPGGGVLVPAGAGVLALLLAAVLGYVTIRGPVPASQAEETAAPAVDTKQFVSRAGGFNVAVPDDMTSSRVHRTAKLVSADKDLVVVVGPGASGRLRHASERFLSTMRHRYDKLTLLGTKPERVDGRQALTTYGRATNARDVKIRFVSVVVRAKPRNYVIAAYTAYDSDPQQVLPRVNALVNGFHVR